jgi:hypothetical protein
MKKRRKKRDHIFRRLQIRIEGGRREDGRVVKWKGGRDERMTWITRFNSITGIPTTSPA